jgi:Uma2 family endonuclease
MIMAIQTPVEQSMDVPTYPIWRLTVEQYHAMIAAGILTDDDLVELLEGWLVTKMPKNRPHSLSTQLTREALAKIAPGGWYVDDQEPITTTDSEPEPDVIVVRGNRRDYVAQPKADDVALVVEVSDATLQRDRTLKLRIYANARIPVYWILNLQDRQLEIYTDPAGLGDQAVYRQRDVYGEADNAPVVIEGREVGQVAVGALV